MDLSGITPPTMNWTDSNLPEQWKKFKRHIGLIFSGPLKGKSEEEQISYFLIWIGEKGRDIHATWSDISDEDAKKLDTYYTKFQSHVQPKLNPIFARYKFNNETQNEDSIDAFVTRLRLSATDCNFANADEMIRDRIVFGTNSTKIREKLINIGADLTLDKAVQTAQSFEYSQNQLRMMSQTDTDIHFVRHSRQRTRGGQTGPRGAQASGGASGYDKGSHRRYEDHRPSRNWNKSSTQKSCSSCGHADHHAESPSCPARGSSCHTCGKRNHWAKLCWSRKTVDAITDVQDHTDDKYDDTSDSDYYIDTVSGLSSLSDRAFVKIDVGPSRTPIKFKIDTGSSANVIPVKHLGEIHLQHPLEPPDNQLISYTGNTLPVVGMLRLPLEYKGRVVETTCYVVDTPAPPLLGIQTSVALGLIMLTYSVENDQAPADLDQNPQSYLTKQDVMKEHGDLFKGIGTIPGECKLHLKENAIPVVNPPRRVPEALRTRLRDELQRMENDGIIQKVTEPTDWVNSMVVVEKPNTGKLRVCLDPKILNDSIRRPHYPMKTLDDVTARLSNAKYFSILDITHAYWSIKIDDESSYLTTFSTPFGRWRYLRLPFGIKSSQDLFQQKIDEIFEGLTGMTCIVDDILVFGCSRQEHDKNVCNVLERARANGIRFNPDKCKVGVTEVPFFGHIITSTGIKADPSKIEAITKLNIPQNRSELETVLGMVNYLQKFAPNLAEITNPMRDLLKKDIEFVWDQPQTDAFTKMKCAVTQSPVLAFFDHQKQVVLECDASKKGVGAAIFQDGRPVAFASKTLTTTESDYANIEREMLAILFGCTRFHQYIYGRRVTVHSDHKPLSAIMKKPLSAAPPRLQRMMLQLQKYDIDVHYVKGKEVPISDLLSRQPLTETSIIEGLDLHVHTVLHSSHITDRRIESLKSATKSDFQMQKLKQTILDGWTEYRTDCDKTIVEFWNHRDELSFENDLIFRGQTIVIPKSIRHELMESVHHGHMGIEKTVQRAKSAMFWPGMTKQITDHILECNVCQTYRKSNQAEPLKPHEVPERPWQCVSTDIFTWDNKEHLVTVDAYSNFFEVDFLSDTKSSTVINKLKVHFARLGIPSKLKSDNGGQFASEKMADFAKEWNFTHEFSSPLNPQSNGLAENAVKIAKRLLQKAKHSGRDPYIAILEYRNTPLKCGYSPSQLLMGRKTRSIIPVTDKHLQPQLISTEKVRVVKQAEKTKQKQYFDKSSKHLAPLKVDEYVRVKVGKIWKPAKVIRVCNDRSYDIQTREGGIYRRNRRLLNQTKETFPEITDFVPNVVSENPNFEPPTNMAPQEPLDQSSPPTLRSPISRPISDKCTYRTRSGREVKPNSLYSGGQWT